MFSCPWKKNPVTSTRPWAKPIKLNVAVACTTATVTTQLLYSEKARRAGRRLDCGWTRIRYTGKTPLRACRRCPVRATVVNIPASSCAADLAVVMRYDAHLPQHHYVTAHFSPGNANIPLHTPTNAVRQCRGFMCNCRMQRAAIFSCRLSNVMETIREAGMLQPMTEFGGITRCSICVDVLVKKFCLRSIIIIDRHYSDQCSRKSVQHKKRKKSYFLDFEKKT